MLPETHSEGVGETMGTLSLKPPSPLRRWGGGGGGWGIARYNSDVPITGPELPPKGSHRRKQSQLYGAALDNYHELTSSDSRTRAATLPECELID